MKNVRVWSRSHLPLPGAGAAQKSAGSATLLIINIINEKEKSTVTTFLFHTKLLGKVQNPQV